MAKIVLVEQDKVSIGMDDGAIKEVRTDDLNFVPHVGDEVEVFETESRTIISKKEQKKDAVPEGGIHINLSNAQNIGAGQVQYAPGKVVKKLVYCLLAFFLGWAGIHKFYAGRIGAGIVYLLFCWTGIPAIIAFIEFIIGLCKKADAAGNIVVQTKKLSRWRVFFCL